MAIAIGSTAIVGLYRQLTLIKSSGPPDRGSKFELEQFNEIESVLKTVSNEFKSVHFCGDMNIDPTRTEEAGYYKKNLLDKWCSVMEEVEADAVLPQQLHGGAVLEAVELPLRDA